MTPGTQPLEGSRCDSCGTVFFPPRALCAHCSGAVATEHVELGPRGHLYSLTNLHVGPIAPCAVGYVDLEDGVRVLARFPFQADPLDIPDDVPVTVSYGAADGPLQGVVVGSLTVAAGA